MIGLVTETSMLGALLEETRGVVGVVLGTIDGELRAVVGSVADGDGGAAGAAAPVRAPRPNGTLPRPGGAAGGALPAAAPRASPPPPASRATPNGSARRTGSAPTVPRPIGRLSRSTNIPAQMKSIGSGPVFSGDLEQFCLPDLLELLRNSHRTGLLT